MTALLLLVTLASAQQRTEYVTNCNGPSVLRNGNLFATCFQASVLRDASPAPDSSKYTETRSAPSAAIDPVSGGFCTVDAPVRCCPKGSLLDLTTNECVVRVAK